MSMSDTNETQAPPSQVAPAAFVQPPKIRIDKGRAYATVHGDRQPKDPHAAVHYTQDGLYYDAAGILILDHPDYDGRSHDADQMRRKLEKKIRLHMAKAAKQVEAATAPGGPTYARGIDDIDDDDVKVTEDNEDEEEEREAINLSAWLRGEQMVEWQDITQEIARRYKKRIASIADAVPFLVKEGVCGANEVAKKFKKFLD